MDDPRHPADGPDAPLDRARTLDLTLCLSGGGYRAALFHLGTLWRLHELGLLGKIERLSSVSGGSILAAWLACCITRDAAGGDQASFARWCAALDFRKTIAEPFRAISRRDIRTWPVIKDLIRRTLIYGWVWPRSGAHDLARAYADHVNDERLRDLPHAPQFVFCATDLTFGVNFEFSRERVGDYQLGYLEAREGGPDPADLPIALAAAASSCFPPVFVPLVLDTTPYRLSRGRYRGADRERLSRRVQLTDGGVYDNLGTEPVIKRARRVLISDAGAPFPFRAGAHPLARLLRYTAVIGNQAYALRRRLFLTLRHREEIEGAHWSLSERVEAGAFGYASTLIEDVLARVRTDLDRFRDDEFEVLVNHGYASCAATLTHRPEAVPEAASIPPQWPYPRWQDEAAVRAALRDSHRRFVPSRWWR